MKNYIKTLMTGLFALTLTAGFAVNAHAQAGSDNDNISATAEVATAIAVTGQENLVFQNVVQGADKSVSSIGAVSGSAATGGEQAGRFEVDKGENTEVIITFGLPTNLNSGDNTLPISFADADGRLSTDKSDETNGTGHQVFDPNSALTLANSDGTGPFFSAGLFYVYIGGTVEPASDQADGSYSADITLTATYN